MKDTKNLVNESILQVFSGFKSELKLKYRTLSLTVSPMHFRSLQVISRNSGCTSQKVAGSLNRDKAQIARLIGELVDQGYVETQPGLADKRERLLTLTPPGKTLMKELQLVEKTVVSRMTKGLSSQELKQFVAISKKMSDNIKHRQKEN
jgi:DNA-binding MarR family transcriptional regulator